MRPSGRRILPCDVRWSTRTKCASAPDRRSQSAMGRVAGFAWCRPTPSWWTPFAQCHTVAQATKFSRGAAASDCPPGPRPGGPQRGSRKRDCRRAATGTGVKGPASRWLQPGVTVVMPIKETTVITARPSLGGNTETHLTPARGTIGRHLLSILMLSFKKRRLPRYPEGYWHMSVTVMTG